MYVFMYLSFLVCTLCPAANYHDTCCTALLYGTYQSLQNLPDVHHQYCSSSFHPSHQVLIAFSASASPNMDIQSHRAVNTLRLDYETNQLLFFMSPFLPPPMVQPYLFRTQPPNSLTSVLPLALQHQNESAEFIVSPATRRLDSQTPPSPIKWSGTELSVTARGVPHRRHHYDGKIMDRIIQP